MKLRRVHTTRGLELRTRDASGSWQATDELSTLGGRVFVSSMSEVAVAMEAGHWLHPADTLELSIDGIGRIEHTAVSA